MSFLRRIRGLGAVPSTRGRFTEPASIYDALRTKIFEVDPKAMGIKPTPELPNVWGVVMDWSLDNGVATIVSLADGTTSMYLSSGGGTIGAGKHEGPAHATLGALRIAESAVAEFPHSANTPIPGPARTALTVLTFTGTRRIEENTAELHRGSSGTSQVANAMQEVIHAIRMTQDGVAT